ncbi:hypothetical protein VaNZ11_016390, partial [Volvox africanus]
TSLAETDPAYAATLCDLAVMKLNQGEVMEAQRIFEQLVVLRSEQLEQASSSVVPNVEEQRSNNRSDRSHAAASPLPPPPQPGPRTRSETRSNISVSVATNSSPPSLSGNGNTNTKSYNSTNTSSSGSSNPRAQQDPSSSRPRVCSGSSVSAMAVGAAMFARALGNRPASARLKIRTSGPEPGTEAPPELPVCDATPAATVANPHKVVTEITARGISAGPSSRSSPRPGSPTSAAAVTAAQEQEKGEIVGRREPARLAAWRVPAAGTERAGMREFRGSSDGKSAATASRAAAVAAVASSFGGMESPRRRMSSGTGEVGPLVLSAAEGLGAAGYATALATEQKVAVTAAVGTPDGAAWESSGGGNTEDSYLPAAAAAVAVMTAKPMGWGPGCGGAAGAKPEGRSGGGCGAGGGSSSGGGGCSSRVVVKDYYLESQGQNGDEADPEATAADAALRASLGECRHVLEVYGLTTEVRTSHLQDFVLEFASQDGRPLPVIKWVDDHHALLVCPDGATALYLLQVDQDLFQLRPFAEASPASRAVAATDLLPPRDRPKTTAAVAKRLLSHALGMSQLRDRSAEKDLAEQRKAAREARLERERKLAAAWDDD